MTQKVDKLKKGEFSMDKLGQEVSISRMLTSAYISIYTYYKDLYSVECN